MSIHNMQYNVGAQISSGIQANIEVKQCKNVIKLISPISMRSEHRKKKSGSIISVTAKRKDESLLC